MHESFIPANTKRATLVLGMYSWVPDVIILVGGTVVTIGLLMALNNAGTLMMIIACIPMAIAVFLTLPLPNYHNVMGALQSIFMFFTGRRNYIWKGWCAQYEFEDDKQ